MKKTLIVRLCSLLLLGGCKASGNNTVPEPEVPETTVIRLARGTHGHVLNAIAESQGYLKEEGIEVRYVRVETDAEVFNGIRNGTIDICSNSGTNLPLQEIASGTDLTIFAGYDLTGCLPVFSRVETEWHGIEDLIGKTVAFEPNFYAITGPLLDRGYDPLHQINWYETEDQMDRITAVLNGDADFGLVGTGLNYEILRNPELKILTYASDVLPEYSCCRVQALTSWINEHPNTVKALLRAWIRALEYYYDHHEESVAITAKQSGVEEAIIRAYMDNPREDLNIDPMKSSVIRAWNYQIRLGLMDNDARKIQIEDHINTELYKEALDACQKRYGKDDPKFYEALQAQYAVNDQ